MRNREVPHADSLIIPHLGNASWFHYLAKCVPESNRLTRGEQTYPFIKLYTHVLGKQPAFQISDSMGEITNSIKKTRSSQVYLQSAEKYKKVNPAQRRVHTGIRTEGKKEPRTEKEVCRVHYQGTHAIWESSRERKATRTCFQRRISCKYCSGGLSRSALISAGLQRFPRSCFH